MVQMEAAARRHRRPPDSFPEVAVTNSAPSATAGLASSTRHRNSHRRISGVFFACRVAAVVFFLTVYRSVYHRLDQIERKYDIDEKLHPKQSMALTGKNTNKKTNKKTKTLAQYLTNENAADDSALNNPSHPSLQGASKGREHIVAILEDAGIDHMDAKDVLRLPLWSSVSGLYYNGNSSSISSSNGPIILGLEGCKSFRETVPLKERFLGVAGNFNSGTTAFGIALQKNCKLEDHSPDQNFVMRKRRSVFASNVHGMLSMVPWAKHKTVDYRYNHTIHPPISIDHDSVLPIVLVRDPFYWMQSMCKEGYGVRWDHDSKHHCPNLISNDFDQKRFKLVGSQPVPVWMGANPKIGPTWPSLIHYWNAWYESYYYNSKNAKDASSSWPRLMIRFEDTLFYPKQVMEKVCHCGGGKLLFDPNGQKYDYSLEESKPDHKHQQKNNFVTAMIEYGTNTTRLRNMTHEDVDFAMEHLNPILMQAFGYSYPNTPEKAK